MRRKRGVLWWLLRALAALVATAVVTVIVFAVSPWPGALVMRAFFQANATKTAKIMEKYAPMGVASVLDVQYAEGSTEPHVVANSFTQLDVYYPTGTAKQLGTIIWTHGGGWISGNKSNDRAYFQLLAKQGYTVIGLNYTYGPEAQYPTAVFELNQAHKFLLANAEKFHINPDQIVLAGDSAGAQLTSQVAALMTNPAYAAQMQFTPVLKPAQVKGLVLNCGVYQMSSLMGEKGLIGWGDDVWIWAYTGDRNINESPAAAQMSTINFVTPQFPPTYISGGNADPLTEGNSIPFAKKLHDNGVSVDELFWPKDYSPPLEHEYQFKLDTPEAQDAFNATVAFLAKQLSA